MDTAGQSRSQRGWRIEDGKVRLAEADYDYDYDGAHENLRRLRRFQWIVVRIRTDYAGAGPRWSNPAVSPASRRAGWCGRKEAACYPSNTFCGPIQGGMKMQCQHGARCFARKYPLGLRLALGRRARYQLGRVSQPDGRLAGIPEACPPCSGQLPMSHP